MVEFCKRCLEICFNVVPKIESHRSTVIVGQLTGPVLELWDALELPWATEELILTNPTTASSAPIKFPAGPINWPIVSFNLQ